MVGQIKLVGDDLDCVAILVTKVWMAELILHQHKITTSNISGTSLVYLSGAVH